MPLITDEQVVLDLTGADRHVATRALAERLVASGRCTDLDTFLADVSERESKMATGLPGGIGIPHARSEHVTEASLVFGRAPQGIDWGAELQGDAVKATVSHFGPAPLIPPVRLIGALTGERGQVDGRLEVEHAFDHNRTAPNETDTDGYTMVNASIDWHPLAKPSVTLSLAANNLFDVDARRSTSVLKDFAPLAGRDVRVTARMGF